MLLQQNPVDPTLPQSMTVDEVVGWPLEIGDLLTTLFDPRGAPLLNMGNNLWTGLAAIVVVWTGLRIAFSGASFRPWDLVSLVIGLSIPLGMLRFYTVDVPGVGLPFPFIIPAGADMIATAFHADLSTEMQMAEAELYEGLRQNLEAAKGTEDTPGILQLGALLLAAVQNFIAWLQTWVLGMVFVFAFVLVYAICLAQVIWAQVALAILIYLGPVLIPWLVYKPMAFLFWGWFRAIWTYSLYSIIAAAVLRIFVAICITMVESMNVAVGVGLNPTEGPEAGNFLLAIIPLLAAAFMAALKVPELAAGIVGGPSGGGLTGAAAMALTGGKAKLAKMAAKGGT